MPPTTRLTTLQPHHRSPLVLLALLTTIACTTPQGNGADPSAAPPQQAQIDACNASLDLLQQLQTRNQQHMDKISGWIQNPDQKTQFDQTRQALLSSLTRHTAQAQALCTSATAQALSPDYQFCFDQSTMASMAVEQQLAQAQPKTVWGHLLSIIAPKQFWLEKGEGCYQKFQSSNGQIGGFRGFKKTSDADLTPKGCATGDDGLIYGGLLTLQKTQGATFNPCQPVQLHTQLVCERQSSPGKFQKGLQCHGEAFVENDRVRLEFSSPSGGFIYVFYGNEKGQFEIIYPDPGQPNLLTPGASYQLPPGDSGWLELDNVGGVIEHLWIVLSSSPIQDLESLRALYNGAPNPNPAQQQQDMNRVKGGLEPFVKRGFDLDPVATRGFDLDPVATRGFDLDPVATRGGTYTGVIQLMEEGASASTLPDSIDAQGQDVVAIEFIVNHQ